MMNNLESAVRALVAAVDGIDWDADTVGQSIEAIHRFGKRASMGRLDVALMILVDRLERFTVKDADGTALVERPSRKQGTVTPHTCKFGELCFHLRVRWIFESLLAQQSAIFFRHPDLQMLDLPVLRLQPESHMPVRFVAHL